MAFCLNKKKRLKQLFDFKIAFLFSVNNWLIVAALIRRLNDASEDFDPLMEYFLLL